MTGLMTGQPLRTERFRVPMGDTDAAQIIYFGAPPRWAERLFTSYLADIGLPTSALLASGHGLPAVDLQVMYRRCSGSTTRYAVSCTSIGTRPGRSPGSVISSPTANFPATTRNSPCRC